MTFRVLILDDDDHKDTVTSVFGDHPDGLRIETEYARFGGGTVTYESTQAQRDWLSSLADNAYDLIIIGNNQGAGIPKAKALPAQLAQRCVVVSFDPLWSSTEREYESVGITRITRRGYLKKYLIEHQSEF